MGRLLCPSPVAAALSLRLAQGMVWELPEIFFCECPGRPIEKSLKVGANCPYICDSNELHSLSPTTLSLYQFINNS